MQNRCNSILISFLRIVHFLFFELRSHRGASIATPDKVEAALKKFKPGRTEVDLDAFVQAAVMGRANTAIAAATFVLIQILVFGSLFLQPLVKSFTGNDILSL